MNLARVVAMMVKLIPRWLMMILATIFLCAVSSFAYVALRRAGLGLIPEAGCFADKASFVVLMSACSFISYWISVLRLVTVMVKIIAGWLLMLLTTLFLPFGTILAYEALRRAGLGILPELDSFGNNATVVVLLSACSFISYWISIRYPVQSRTASPAALNSSPSSECGS